MSELERAVRDAWPGCELNMCDDGGPFAYARIGTRLEVTSCADEDGAWCVVWMRSSGGRNRLGSSKGHLTPAAAIAAAREQAREVLRGWLEAV